MLFKKKFNENKIGNIRLGNGSIQFQRIRLNVYSFEVDGVLIDAGAHSLLQQFKPFFSEADVDQVIITHYHEDHTGCAKYLQDTYGYPVYMNEMTIPECQLKADYPLYRKLFWGARPAFGAQPIGKTFESRSATWDVIDTPGHAKDHLAFLNRETGQLFTGDLYVSPKTKVILREESVPTIIDSLERVLTFDFEEAFCCHAGYIENGRQALTNKLDYLLELQHRVQGLRAEGLSENEIHEQLFSKKYPITRVSFGEWDSKHIVASILKNG
ncbi:MBL fold metallo-hydrolase [Solibacillus sp. FSL H8-0538]|uniref:MBL fold metallo-hydrolase n=1 Tax=Solibacillus sp. FSL H8-0538 TaxID=2921400 RepID=UPI0030F80D68